MATILDYKFLMDEVTLRTSDKVKQHLLLLRVVAHAQNSHGMFKQAKRAYSLTTPDHIYEVLNDHNGGNFDAEEWREWSQDKIDSVFSFFRRISEGENLEYYHDEEGEPLMGYEMFRGRKVMNHDHLLTGGYLGACMDTYNPWRRLLEEVHGIVTGGGMCVPIDLEEMVNHGHKTFELEHREHNKRQIQQLRMLGVIPKAPIKPSKTVISGYVRQAVGRGICDDLAITNAGILYGIDAALGVFLADAVDTWEKNTSLIMEGGQDSKIADIILNNKKKRKRHSMRFKIPIEDKVIAWMKPAAAVHYPPNTVKCGAQLPHCSQSYMLQVNPDKGKNIIESNLSFIVGKSYPTLDISHPALQVTNRWLFGEFTKYLVDECRTLYSTLFPRKIEQFLTL